ncbi:ribonuclease HIII [Leuconostoc rapi]|uniref:AFWIR motif membrane protein n=1 Tax=Leuconostoc rapi TaxID=1406906 RepID=UPI001958975C|nr:ribonuclease HIII [Leuconostoc rapi]MBM7436058.1 membrane protein implicated in regulation of membrane protease activity [Leuconostoc rapi]
MLNLLFITLLILFLIIYFLAALFFNTFGVVSRLILAIILVLLVTFVIKNFFAVVGVLILIILAFWIRKNFTKPPKNQTTDSTFDGHFEEVDKNK